MLKRLQNPGDYVSQDTIEETLRTLRSWPRWVARCHAVNMQPPDPSVLAQGLKKMTAKYVGREPGLSLQDSDASYQLEVGWPA